MRTCPDCETPLPDESRFCITCGRALEGQASIGAARPDRAGRDRPEEMDPRFLYAMVAGLALAVLFPPWESPPGEPPAFLGFHFILTGPGGESEGVISRFLWTIELVTIAIAGFYFSWLFRKR